MAIHPLPKNLKSTLKDLESTLSEWEQIVPDVASETTTSQIQERAGLEKDLQQKARDILFKLKTQIDDLS